MKNFHIAGRMAVLFLTFLAAASAHGGDDAQKRISHPPESILFVGNSFTFYNNSIYTYLRKLLVAQDPATREQIFLKSMTISGAVLGDHRGGLGQMLESRDWDIVVLQGHSREAITPELTPGFRSALAEFSASVRSDGAEPVLFMTWAYADRPEMTAALVDSFTKLGREFEVTIVPVGLAFAEAIRQVPGIRLHDPDSIHPSPTGTYLAAAVFYSVLYAKSPVGLDFHAHMDEGLARELQRIAWQTVKDYAGN
jgi:hypothetical protein